MIKGLEALKVIYNSQDIQGGYDEFWEAYRIIEKDLKALEIIKEKIKIEFNDHYLGIKDNYYIIVNNNVFGAIKIDKEKYDLLKGVYNATH